MPRFCFAVLGPAVLSGLFLNCLVMAQTSDGTQPPDRIEVFGGYAHMNPDFTLVTPNSVNGWNASANFKASPKVGFVADFSGFYPSYTYPGTSSSVSGTAYTFLFGPQVSIPIRRFSPFGRFLMGFSHVSPQDFAVFKSNNALSFAAGGGLDYWVTRRIGIRGQADWLYARLTPIGGGDPGVNYVKNRNVGRISTGVVFRF